MSQTYDSKILVLHGDNSSRSLGQFPTRTTPHQDHYKPVNTNQDQYLYGGGIVKVGSCPDTQNSIQTYSELICLSLSATPN